MEDLEISKDEVYASAVSKRAVARACIALGFKQSEPSAIDSLADITHYYIQTIATAAKEYAELSSRGHIGIHDVIAAMESTVSTRTSI